MRKCPSCKSSSVPGKTKKGVDGKMWTSYLCSNGSYRWVRKTSLTKAKPKKYRHGPQKFKASETTRHKVTGISKFHLDEDHNVCHNKFRRLGRTPSDEEILDCVNARRMKHSKSGLGEKIGRAANRARSNVRARKHRRAAEHAEWTRRREQNAAIERQQEMYRNFHGFVPNRYDFETANSGRDSFAAEPPSEPGQGIS